MMNFLQSATFVVLAVAFCFRLPRAIAHREARLTCIGTGVGALALLTLGTIIPQSVLDLPLGGHNLLKLVQTSLALIAIWLGAQAAIALAPAARRMSLMSLAVMVALPAIPFLLIHRTETTNTHFLDHNIRQLPAWLYATLYLVALVYVALRLVIAFRWHTQIGAWLIRLGALAIVVASVTEMTNFTIQLLDNVRGPTGPILTPIFNIVFYLGVCTMTFGIVAYTSTRAIRQWQVTRALHELENGPLAQRPQEAAESAPSQLGELYLTTVAVRDLLVAGKVHLDYSQLRALHRAERIIAHSLADPLSEGSPTVTIYTGKTAP
jgi:hypothetical protein